MQNLIKQILLKTSLMSATFLSAQSVNAQTDVIKTSQFTQAAVATKYAPVLYSNFQEFKKSLWEKYLKDVQSLTELKKEFQSTALKYKDKTMRFSIDKKGNTPANGSPLYIALHGGGGTQSYVNDGQWEHMKIYYKDSVNQGVYVAPRGITDSWKLHWEDESFTLYDKLIECMVLFEGVDSNRVYILGFSAGGDGVYQVIPKMPDRFAAANMSAGHNNGVTFDNLYNTPFLMQVGELDSAYNRNRVGAENDLALDKLNLKYGGGYIHDLFLHAGYGHNGWPDNSAARSAGNVIKNSEEWLTQNNRETKTVNSNAIDWLNNYTRNPYPQKIVWDLSVGSLRAAGIGATLLAQQDNSENIKLALPHELFYWLDVSVADQFPAKGKLVVETHKSENVLRVLEATNIDKFRILLSSELLNLDNPIDIQIGTTQIATIHAKPNLKTMQRTLYERSDKNYIFESEVTLHLNKETGVWEVINS